MRQRWFCVLFCLLVMITELVPLSRAADSVSGDSKASTIDKLRQKYDFENAKRMSGDCEIPEDEHFVGTLVGEGGTLVIRGYVQGDVVMLYGDIELAQTGRVDGDVSTLDGKIWRHREAVVGGALSEHRSENDVPDPFFSVDPPKAAKSWVTRGEREKGKEEPWFEYNRVDGLTLGLVLPTVDWWYAADHSFAIFGRLGYASKPKEIHYQAGLEKRISRVLRLSIGAEAHRWTQTEDRWIVDDLENTVAALLLREDFRDYYGLEGHSFYATSRLKALRLTAGYHSEQMRNLPKRTDWSIFGGDKRFRTNPNALHQGFSDEEPERAAHLRGYRLGFEWNTRKEENHLMQGWWITGFVERFGDGLKSDCDFQRAILDLRRYQKLSWNERVVLRLRAGSTSGVIPPAYVFDLGGLSTLRGFSFKSFSGNRMVLGNFEYGFTAFNQNDGFWSQWVYIVFVDTGSAWFTDGDLTALQWPIAEQERDRHSSKKLAQGFGALTWSGLKTNIGIALAGRNDYWRINFAKRTDRGGDDFVVTLRIQQEI